jgi:dUTP pyrophosphatase
MERIPTGVAFSIPAGYFGKIYERSGYSAGNPIGIKAGVIDAGYIGEVILVVHNHGDMPQTIESGTKLAQIAFHEVPSVELEQVDNLETTVRNDKGFGSTGNA